MLHNSYKQTIWVLVTVIAFVLHVGFVIQEGQAQDHNQTYAERIQSKTTLIQDYALLNTMVNLDIENQTRLQAVQEITEKAGFNVSYDTELPQLQETVRLQMQRVTTEEALWAVLKGSGLRFAVSQNRQLVLVPFEEPAKVSLQETITGRVTDEQTGEELPGVNIVVEGTTIGTTTDANGEYSVNIPHVESTLVFSFVGYTTQRINIGDQVVINVSLQQDLRFLDEVIVVGYGTVSRSDLTGSVSQISANDFERVPAVNPLMSLQGRAPGLRIIPNSGEPGASASIRVRGEQSISGTNAPIFVIDGSISTSIDHLNSDDIESVSVLKDASAVAIYGSRASNGVILITTKRGVPNTSPEIRIHTYTGIQHESNLRLNLLNAAEFLEIFTEAYENTGITVPWSDADLAEFEGVDEDWMDAIMKTGYQRNVDVSVAGGSDRSTYFVSTSYINNDGMVRGLDYNRANLRLNTDHEISSWLRFGNRLNLFSSTTNGMSGQYHGAIQKVPLTRIYEDDGSYGRIRNVILEHRHVGSLFRADQVRERIDRGAMGNLYLTASLIDGLEFTVRGNLEYTTDYRTSFNQGVPQGLGWEGSSINSLEKDNRITLFWLTDYLLDFSRPFFSERHHFNGLLGYSREEQTSERLVGSGTGTPNDRIRYLDAADPTTRLNSNSFSDWAFVSLFGRFGYTFDDKYILNATLRRDGTSRLDEAHRYGLFPSVSAAWRISQENFMQDVNMLNELKLRVSWGRTGNVMSISTYGTKSSLQSWNYPFGNVQRQGFTLATAVNTDLKWEATEKFNVGVDVEMFDSRFYVIADVFRENTFDLLFTQPIPLSTGLTGSPFINAGLIRNTGVEFDFGYRQVIGDWRYSVSANLTHFKNEVIDLEGRDLRTSGIEEGYPLRSFFGYKSNGLIRTQEDLDNHAHFPGKQIGDIWLLDQTGDGVVGPDDRVILGNDFPDLIYGITGTIGYSNLTMQVQLQGIHGVLKDIRGGSNLGALHYFTQWAKNHDRLILDRYHPERNPDGKFPRVTVDDSGNNLLFSDFWLSDASYLRVSNVNLNYDFPTSRIQRLGIRDLSVYISVQNLYTFTNFYGPEVDSNADVLTGVPQPRTWTFGLRLGII